MIDSAYNRVTLAQDIRPCNR